MESVLEIEFLKEIWGCERRLEGVRRKRKENKKEVKWEKMLKLKEKKFERKLKDMWDRRGRKGYYVWKKM